MLGIRYPVSKERLPTSITGPYPLGIYGAVALLLKSDLYLVKRIKFRKRLYSYTYDNHFCTTISLSKRMILSRLDNKTISYLEKCVRSLDGSM